MRGFQDPNSPLPQVQSPRGQFILVKLHICNDRCLLFKYKTLNKQYFFSPYVSKPLGEPYVNGGAAPPLSACPAPHWKNWAAPAVCCRAESRGQGASMHCPHWSKTSAAHLDPASASCSQTLVLVATLRHLERHEQIRQLQTNFCLYLWFSISLQKWVTIENTFKSYLQCFQVQFCSANSSLILHLLLKKIFTHNADINQK